MNLLRMPIVAIAALAANAAAAQAPRPIAIPATPAIAQEPDPTSSLDVQVRSTVLPGAQPMPVLPRANQQPPRHGDISLNLPAADVQTVARTVLGDLLHRNYTIAQGVTGTVTLVTPYPVAKSALLGLLENALRSANLALEPVADGYEIQIAANAQQLIAPEATGFGAEVINLRFINPDQLRKLLDTVLPGVVTSTSPATGTLTIAGTTGQRASARDLAHQFDVDWLRNTSFGFYVPERTDARLIVPSLNKLINAPDSPTQGLVRLIAMEQLNGILAISTQPQYLDDVRRWIEILDREGEANERRIFVYRVQNGRARELTRTINAAYGASGDSSSAGGPSNGGAGPDPFGDNQQARAMSMNANSAPNAGANSGMAQPRGGEARSSGGRAGEAEGASGSPQAHVTADENNNAVIVFGTPREFAIVEDALRKLDVPPKQILIEAAITEVSLTNKTSFGVQWNYASGNTSVGFSGGATSAPTQIFPGFSYFYSGNSITATLNALQQHTQIKVVSAPKLLVLNNQTAALQVGDEVPISTGTATGLSSSTSAIVSTIEYKDTGVILKITPRVNASGMVQLDVSQEVSEVSTPTTNSSAQQQSPTISTRRISTTVAVRDGQVIALGGLFSDQKTVDKSGIPILSQIPYIGGLFGTHTINHLRTELIILLKPHVLATDDDARAVTDELRQKLHTMQPFRTTGRMP
jgi:general secretion pathway protein D